MKPPNLIHQISVAGRVCSKKSPNMEMSGEDTSKTHILPHLNMIHRKSCLFGEMFFQVFLPIWNVF